MLALATALATPVFAADANSGGEVIVTGTRTTGMKAADSAAPIEIVGAAALRNSPQPDLIQALATNLPSFNAQGYGADAQALTLSAALRGISPNDTLVLVDGKRRHTTANLGVDGGSPYSGSATTDLSFIPVSAIDHIEVLQDGASAQYGSDAIAGVVNIILKDANHGGSASATAGEFYESDGKTGAISLNKGIALGDAGFLNITAEERYHEHTQQGTYDRRVSTVSGAPLPGLTPPNSTGELSADGYPKENKIFGDPAYNIYNFMYNAGYDLGGGVEAYAFGSYGHREANSFENYRVPNKVSGCELALCGTPGAGTKVYPYPSGFSPSEAITEDDYSLTEGVKGDLAGWKWDLSTTYGKDTDKVYTDNSANASLYPVIQAGQSTPYLPPLQNYYDGTFANSEWTTNVDVDKAFPVGLASPLNVGFGAEYRKNTFSLSAGEPSSYYGGGAQSFTGYDPTNAGSHSRDSYAGYVDLAVDPITGLHLDLAGRYSHFSDFGGDTVGKFTGRYDFNPAFAIRGTVSTGFRAPTLAEEYYSGTNVSPSSAEVQLPPNSAAAVAAGFGPLKPEKSTNYSIGFVAHPIDKMQITLDAYQIDITDRIVTTGFLYGSVLSGGTNYVISQAVLNAIALHGNTLDTGISYAGIALFTNAVDTRTQGVEATLNYASDFGDLGHVDWNAGFNYNENKVTKEHPLPAVDASAFPGIQSQTTLLSPSAISALTTATPKEKLILGADWSLGQFSVTLRETVYGPTSELSVVSNTTYDLKIPTTGITDLDVGYKIVKGLKLDVGAQNLFNTKPPITPNNAAGRPESGSNVYGVPLTFSPWGINGGYYYGRLTYTF